MSGESQFADVLSYGGGRQTVAICVLVAQGKLPRPERIVCADTGREAQSTWDYLDAQVAPLLSTVGLTVEIASHDLATVDLYSGNGDLLIPAYTKDGKLPTFCSTEWKRRPVRRWLRTNGYGPAKPVSLWLGISVDEVGRAKPSPTSWITHRYPLLMDVALNKRECVALVKAAGLPEPPRSSCWMCPHRADAEWLALSPVDRVKANALDAEIRSRDITNGNGGIWLHKSRKPLAELSDAELTKPTEVLPLFGEPGQEECESGYCFI
jgi:hypothetical protein